MEVILKVTTRQFIYTTNPKVTFTYNLDLSHVPHEGERLELDCKDGNFYGVVTCVETYVNMNTNEERIYVNLADEIEPQNKGE